MVVLVHKNNNMFNIPISEYCYTSYINYIVYSHYSDILNNNIILHNIRKISVGTYNII